MLSDFFHGSLRFLLHKLCDMLNFGKSTLLTFKYSQNNSLIQQKYMGNEKQVFSWEIHTVTLTFILLKKLLSLVL